LCSIFFTTTAKSQGEAYCNEYYRECEKAKVFYVENKSLFEAAALWSGFGSEFLLAIVAPEYTQYSYLSNKIESYSLKVFYVQGGKDYSDFSIGFFQMKPSFIERLEEYVSSDSLLKQKYADCLFAQPDERASRVARIDRLNTIEWQIKYLTLFCEVIKSRFGFLSFVTQEEKLRFYASAYNCGFHKSEDEIKHSGQRALFPHFSTCKFIYADISVWFYSLIEN
jgi:hypothetical protein